MKKLIILLSLLTSFNSFSSDDVAVKCRKEIEIALNNYISSGWTITSIYLDADQDGVCWFQVYLAGYQLDIIEHVEVENSTCRVH